MKGRGTTLPGAARDGRREPHRLRTSTGFSGCGRGSRRRTTATATSSTTCRRRACGASSPSARSAAAAVAARSSTAASPSAPGGARARPTSCSSTTRCTWPTSACAAPATAPSAILPRARPRGLRRGAHARGRGGRVARRAALATRRSPASRATSSAACRREPSAEVPAAARAGARQLHAERFFGALPAGRASACATATWPRSRTTRQPACGRRSPTSPAPARSAARSADTIARQAERLAVAVDAVLEPDHDETVVWSERAGRDVQLRTAPIDVAPRARRAPLRGDRGRRRCCPPRSRSTTASRTCGATLGVASARELRLPSPFDVERNALLCVPRAAPATGGTAGASPAALAALMEQLVRASEGRALLLFSSYRQLHAVHELLAPRLPYTVLRQGEAPRERLLESFPQRRHERPLRDDELLAGHRRARARRCRSS